MDAAIIVMALHDIYVIPKRYNGEEYVPVGSPANATYFLEQIYTALKPGSRFIVVEHAGDASMESEEVFDLHRMVEAVRCDRHHSGGYSACSLGRALPILGVGCMPHAPPLDEQPFPPRPRCVLLGASLNPHLHQERPSAHVASRASLRLVSYRVQQASLHVPCPLPMSRHTTQPQTWYPYIPPCIELARELVAALPSPAMRLLRQLPCTLLSYVAPVSDRYHSRYQDSCHLPSRLWLPRLAVGFAG